MSLTRVLRSTPATPSVTFYDGEDPVDADADVTYSVTVPDGSVLTSGTATHGATGVYSFVLGPQADLTRLTIAWTGNFSSVQSTVTSNVEIVGAYFFTLTELRESDDALSDTTKYPSAKLEDKRTEVEDFFEKVCDRAFVRRYEREILSGNGTPYLLLKHPEASTIISLTVDDEDWSAYSLGSDGKYLVLNDGNVWSATEDFNIVVEYEYGALVTPFLIKERAKKYARHLLVASRARIDERATVMQIPDFGTFNLATPGVRGSYTGIPDVDVVLAAYSPYNSGIG